MNKCSLPLRPYVVLLAALLACTSAVRAAEAIHPAINTIKTWLLTDAPDQLDNGMRKSVTYFNPLHTETGATPSYGVPQSSAIARTCTLLCEYYIRYNSPHPVTGDIMLTTTEKTALYNEIITYTKKLLQYRKYSTYWGWTTEVDANLEDADLETGKFYHGAIATAANYTYFTALGNAFGCEALLAAAKVANLRGDTTRETKWINSAKLVGDFLCRLADPYNYYATAFAPYVHHCMISNQGNPITKVGMVYSSVSAAESLSTEILLQNMYAILPLKELTALTGIPSYDAMAVNIINQMTIGLANDFYTGYYPKYQNDATGPAKLFSNDFKSNAWESTMSGVDACTGAPTGVPMVGDDGIEYALAALWKYHGLTSSSYTFTYYNGGGSTPSPFDMKVKTKRFQDAAAGSALLPNYDSYISFTGYFRKPTSTWLAWMPYYDIVGFGLLGELRKAVFSTQYSIAWQDVIGSKVSAGRTGDLLFVMFNDNLDVYWSSGHETSRGTLSSVAIALSLLNITPYASSPAP